MALLNISDSQICGITVYVPSEIDTNGQHVLVSQMSKFHQYNLKKNDVDVFVFHQANKYLLDILRKNLRIDTDRFYFCMSYSGNTVSSTIPIALKEALDDHSVQEGMYLLLAGFGVGYSWAGTILKCK
jgi:3-oxoacyl-[acyl-carrier-protein] synthase III